MLSRLLLALVILSSVTLGHPVAQSVTSSVATLPADGKLAGVGVVYSKSFFQERYMRLVKTIGYALFIPRVF